MPNPDVGSPEWWIRRLHSRIQARNPYVATLRNYYDGEHRLAFASEKFQEAFGGLFSAFSDNWCGTVVDAVEERLNVVGFRVGNEPEADEGAAEIWQRNNLDCEAQLAHTEALVAGVSFATAWRDGDGMAQITVEPSDCAEVELDPRNRKRRRAGLRLWTDDWGHLHGELFTPDYVATVVSERDVAGGVGVDSIRWKPEQVDGADENGIAPNPLEVVPMVPFVNRQRLWSRRQGLAAGSELVNIIPLQDAVNKLIADMMVSSESDALPLRTATGYEPARDPETNEIIRPEWAQKANRSGWAVVPNKDTKFGQLDAADLTRFVKAVEMVVQHIASISRTPPHYLNSSADRLSGESIKSAETGLVAKTKRRFVPFGESWEEVMRIAGRIDGIESLSTATRAETIWRDPESRTEGEMVDAALKKHQIDVPSQQLWEDVGYTPHQIARFPAMRTQNALLDAVRAVNEATAVAGVADDAG